MSRTLRTITVARLQEILEGEKPDALVIFSTDYGDYSHTPQALPLRGDTEEVKVQKSAYSNSGYSVVTEEDEDFEEDDSQTTTYLLLK